MDREALGIYKGVLNIWGVGGIRMVSRCMGPSKHMGVSRCPHTYGCQVNALKEVILNSFYFGRV